MMYLFHGSDSDKVRRKAFAWVAAARAKEPNLAYVRLVREELTDSALEDAALSGGLFVKRLLVLIDDPFQSSRTAGGEDDDEKKTEGSLIEEHIDRLTDSDNAIIIVAPKLAAAKAKKLAARAKAEYRYDKPVAHETARGFNKNVVNALATHSRERLWLEINRALRAGDAPEMIHGLLHWKARDLMEKGGGAWKAQESRDLSLSLIELLQNSRRGGLNLPLSLERLALSI